MKTPAFKEWDSVIRALGCGASCLILRKGGIHEERRLFEIRHSSFLLFPTFEHQAAEDLQKDAGVFLQESLREARLTGRVCLRFEAVLERAWWVGDLAKIEAAHRLHAYSLQGARKKFEWGDRRPGVYALLVRVKRWVQPWDIAERSAYGGCRSWIGIEEVPSRMPPQPSVPVLEDARFGVRAAEAGKIFHGCEEICEGGNR